MSEISLTVTEANTDAIELYRSEGYECAHISTPPSGSGKVHGIEDKSRRRFCKSCVIT